MGLAHLSLVLHLVHLVLGLLQLGGQGGVHLLDCDRYDQFFAVHEITCSLRGSESWSRSLLERSVWTSRPWGGAVRHSFNREDKQRLTKTRRGSSAYKKCNFPCSAKNPYNFP